MARHAMSRRFKDWIEDQVTTGWATTARGLAEQMANRYHHAPSSHAIGRYLAVLERRGMVQRGPWNRNGTVWEAV